MNKLVPYFLLFALLLSACGGRGQSKKTVEDTTVRTMADSIVVNNCEDSVVADIQQDSIPDSPTLRLPPEPAVALGTGKSQSEPRTTPSRKVVVEISDTIPDIGAEIYYYSPRMESEDYSYRKELGSDNNFLGLTDMQNREMVSVPDTIEYGAKLMFHAVGYERLELPMDSIIGKDRITVQFVASKMYRSTAVLNEKLYRDTISVISVKNFHETPPKIFYGKCLPIWNDDGINHADPYCAFACMGCYPKFEFSQYAHAGNHREMTELYRALKSGENCSLLIVVDKHIIREVEIIGFTNSILESYRENRLGEWISDGHRFQYLLTLEAR